MITNKRILKIIAKNHKIDPVELLVGLWDSFESKFNYLNNENSVVKNKDLRYVQKAIEAKQKNIGLRNKKNALKKPVQLRQIDHDFSSIGKTLTSMAYITEEEVMRIYNELVTDFDKLEDPIQPSGIKDRDLLDSAIFHGQTSYENNFKYTTAESAAAALMYAISHNHAFHNGNKRTAMVAMLVFLDRHHVTLICSEDDLFKISLKLADHKLVTPEYLYPDAEIYELARWIHSNSKIIQKGERPVTLKKLKQIFYHFNCKILENGRVKREVKYKSFLGERIKTLTSKKTIGETISDGQEVDRGLIKSIREDLELTSNYGIDSEIFYERANFTISDFISKYKNLLKRLSRV